MAGDPRWLLRQAIRNRLLGTAGLTALVSTRVHDEVPEDPVFPFVVIDTLNMSGENADKTNRFNDVTASIYAWSTYQGYKEVEQISTQIYDALHEPDWSGSPSEVPGYTLLSSRFVDSEEGRDGEGKGRFSLNRFVFLVDAL